MQVDRAEALYLRQVSREKIRRELVTLYGINLGQADDRITAVLARWNEESNAEGDRGAKRIRMRSAMRDLYLRTLSIREPLRDRAGEPMFHPKTGDPLWVDTPDLRTGLRTLEALSRLDGLDKDATGTTSLGDVVSAAAAALRRAKATREEDGEE